VQDRQNGINRRGQTEKDRQNRAGRTGQAEMGQAAQDLQKWTGGTRLAEQDRHNRTVRAGQTGGIGQAELESQN
jgi:hypothetical protein